MNKTILYRLFGFGSIPKKLRPVLQAEHIVVSDEGIAGRFITKNVTAPGRRYIHRSEGFSGFPAITGKRIICFSYWKRQIKSELLQIRGDTLHHTDCPRDKRNYLWLRR